MAALEGYGLGLRPEHYAAVPGDERGRLDWVEVISENYMIPGGRPLAHLDRIRRELPMVMHGVSLSIGGTDPLDRDYLAALRRLARRVEPAWVSDHLCWTRVDARQLHDLMPLPCTHAALAHTASRVQQVQEFLGRALVLEGVSAYVQYAADEMPEPEFIRELVRRTGCKLLLDVNNVYVNAVNFGFDARRFIAAMPAASVAQYHLAGHRDEGRHLVDTHDAPVCGAVWDLYRYAVQAIGPRPTMIERDDDIPALGVLLDELDIARAIAGEVEREVAA